ncbi:MAG: HAMP domain-containing histidine kinase [Leptolyngbyaceae cyanobacterium HOT.MB2.61]|jgi:signal transduction histidine kinase|nr:HAMP domain-containing histidine kinase [Leptolyngbyaceae cyanobacterium HOT.MB2.61]
MHRSKLFNQTRLQLAIWYAAVMGAILGLAGLTTYQMVAHSQWEAVQRELQSISGTLHDSLEPKLKRSGYLEPTVQIVLPNLCLVGNQCASSSKIVERHILNAFQQNGYYIRFFDQQGTLLATAGQVPTDLPGHLNDHYLQTLEGQDGIRYQQYSLRLKSQNGLPWGYMQVGRSLKEFDDYLAFLRLTMLAGLPISMLLVAAASWSLAGLAMKPIYRSYQRMQQFTADAAHELRTPLATIRAIVESTRDVDFLTEEEAKEALAGVDRQNQRLVQLTQDLLLLSRLEAFTETWDKQVEKVESACCLNDLILDVTESLSVLEIAAPIQLATQIQVAEPLYVVGDESQLVRLISNLVTNALQYTPAGGKVTVTLGKKDQHALIQIQDTGIGIAIEDQAHIFDRFYRVSRDRSRHTGGAGLGLAIAKAIVQVHQGTIQLQSEPGKGSTFTIRLPLLPPLLTEFMDESERSH